MNTPPADYGADPIFTALGEDGDTVDTNNFILPILGSVLEQASSEIHGGKGFVIIRGLDPKSLSVEDNMVAFLGIASHVGGDQRGVQDRKGNVISKKLSRNTDPILDCWAFD